MKNLERNSIRAEALAEGITQGRNEGIWEAKTQIVLKMFRRNMPVEDIADISGCSVGEVNEILKMLRFFIEKYSHKQKVNQY